MFVTDKQNLVLCSPKIFLHRQKYPYMVATGFVQYELKRKFEKCDLLWFYSGHSFRILDRHT